MVWALLFVCFLLEGKLILRMRNRYASETHTKTEQDDGKMYTTRKFRGLHHSMIIYLCIYVFSISFIIINIVYSFVRASSGARVSTEERVTSGFLFQHLTPAEYLSTHAR